MIFPGTRNPRSLCTRAAVVPAKLREAEAGVLAIVTFTNGTALCGSAAAATWSVGQKTDAAEAAPTPT
jgi:hypothetical protein